MAEADRTRRPRGPSAARAGPRSLAWPDRVPGRPCQLPRRPYGRARRPGRREDEAPEGAWEPHGDAGRASGAAPAGPSCRRAHGAGKWRQRKAQARRVILFRREGLVGSAICPATPVSSTWTRPWPEACGAGPPAPVPASVRSGPTGRPVSRRWWAPRPRGGAERWESGVGAGGRQRRGTPSKGKTKRRKGVGGGAGAPEAAPGAAEPMGGRGAGAGGGGAVIRRRRPRPLGDHCQRRQLVPAHSSHPRRSPETDPRPAAQAGAR